jgi:hypothetical protein
MRVVATLLVLGVMLAAGCGSSVPPPPRSSVIIIEEGTLGVEELPVPPREVPDDKPARD